MLEPEKLFDLQKIHSTNTDNSLVEINEEMSELLDKQVWQPNTKLNKGLTASVGEVTKVCNENKEKEKMTAHQKIF